VVAELMYADFMAARATNFNQLSKCRHVGRRSLHAGVAAHFVGASTAPAFAGFGPPAHHIPPESGLSGTPYDAKE